MILARQVPKVEHHRRHTASLGKLNHPRVTREMKFNPLFQPYLAQPLPGRTHRRLLHIKGQHATRRPDTARQKLRIMPIARRRIYHHIPLAQQLSKHLLR
jgi:hypothetical protein